LWSKDFDEIHTPKLLSGASEGGAAVFKLLYNGQRVCLAQSPQLHKQMAIVGGYRRVFEVGPVFRAETSLTHRHLCEFTGLDVEMEIKEHYSEVCDAIDVLFVSIFKHLNENCKEELETINSQYPFEPLKEAGTEIKPMGDLNTEAEKKLGQLVKEKAGRIAAAAAIAAIRATSATMRTRPTSAVGGLDVPEFITVPVCFWFGVGVSGSAAPGVVNSAVF
ncbi:Aspartate--tRNA ligase 2, cytoplasmic, partial [Dichanthelium oligosanthes]